jgi:hypothetical protein
VHTRPGGACAQARPRHHSSSADAYCNAGARRAARVPVVINNTHLRIPLGDGTVRNKGKKRGFGRLLSKPLYLQSFEVAIL